ncbi:MucB/RseB C-terminal domain-containing protein [Pasteurellaceae bacterium 20609_3]|uniref:MucB/RseB C-terminal domain-containing protein n=1 Tax=Spirabiliibacterium mucosae TaxID=28156 RepID=UPI001AADA9C1|nr:MucB/RseB C-terminal domain-containing protein [Spirabiliibacterium mucosae]MBE2897318.1 MucB/RseB C-terminal domain-containing protein [Spirabiliibacterium mucosae]
MKHNSYLLALCLAATALYPSTLLADDAPREAVAAEQTQRSSLDALAQMTAAWRNSDFDITFVKLMPNEVNSYQYRHLYHNGKHYAQLFSLDGARQEIIQRDDIVSYFGSNYQPFSLKANAIIDDLPSAVYADFDKLKAHYDFIDAGKTRIANRIAQVVRILPKDDFRYQYVLWIDSASHLLMRSDMLDRNGNLLEQFRVTSLTQGDTLKGLIAPIEQLHLPPVIALEGDAPAQDPNWHLSWLPPGFELRKHDKYQTDIGELESLLFSDGLFSFSLYLNPNISDNLGEHAWQQENNTIYTLSENHHEITLIGEIPLITAKQIVKDITFSKSAK